MTYGFLSILPPLLAICLALRSKQVLLSLTLGVFGGWVILDEGNILTAFLHTAEAIVNVFQNKGSARTIIFTLLIGVLIQLIQYSGGMRAFVSMVQSKLESSRSPSSKVQLLTAISGFLIFIESNISVLTVGTTFRPLFDKYKISRQKLAYLIDSSSAPSCILFPINAWGAYIMGLIAAFDNLDPFKILLYSIPFNFYPILTLALVFYLAAAGKSHGLMRKFDQNIPVELPRVENEKPVKRNGGSNFMVLPILVMIISMPVYLVYTGWDYNHTDSYQQLIWNSIGNGSGSSSVLYSVLTSIIFLAAMMAIKRSISLVGFFEESLKGMKDMLTMAVLMVLAFAIGNVCNELETGVYIANISRKWLSPATIPLILFITSCFVAFSTGTSWGTFAIMISIAVPLSQTLYLNPYLLIAAVLGGGVFGDHCSPISDTTLISSVASGSDHIDHVRTQLPYALFTGGIAAVFYLLAGIIMG